MAESSKSISINPDDLEIDNEGRILVKNSAVSEELKKSLRNITPGAQAANFVYQCGCNFSFGCGDRLSMRS